MSSGMGAVWVRTRRTPFPTDRQPQAKTPSVSVLQNNFEFSSAFGSRLFKPCWFDVNFLLCSLKKQNGVCWLLSAAEVWCEHNKMQKTAPTYSQESLLMCCWQKDGQECDTGFVQMLTSSRTVVARVTRSE